MADIARELGCSEMTVNYYKQKILGPTMRLAREAKDSLERRSAREKLSFLFADADKLLKGAIESKDARGGSQCVKVMHEIIRTELELDGDLNQQPNNSTVMNAEVIQVLTLPKAQKTQVQPLAVPPSQLLIDSPPQPEA